MPTETPQPVPPSPPSYVWVGVLMGVLILAVQAILIFIVLDTRSGVNDVSDGLRQVELRLAGGGDADDGAVAAPTTEPAVPPATSEPAPTSAPDDPASPDTTLIGLDELPSSPAPEFATDAEGLPRLESNTVEDPAIGAELGDLVAVEWESGDELTIELDDGNARAIVVWAPWCEPCRELLAQLDEWHAGLEAPIENVELVTIASAVDADPETSLVDYLADQGFSFPVLVDSDDELAARLGVNAFPFWAFVAPDGRVIGRVAGQLPPVQFISLFADLEEIAAEG